MYDHKYSKQESMLLYRKCTSAGDPNNSATSDCFSPLPRPKRKPLKTFSCTVASSLKKRVTIHAPERKVSPRKTEASHINVPLLITNLPLHFRPAPRPTDGSNVQSTTVNLESHFYKANLTFLGLTVRLPSKSTPTKAEYLLDTHFVLNQNSPSSDANHLNVIGLEQSASLGRHSCTVPMAALQSTLIRFQSIVACQSARSSKYQYWPQK